MSDRTGGFDIKPDSQSGLNCQIEECPFGGIVLRDISMLPVHSSVHVKLSNNHSGASIKAGKIFYEQHDFALPVMPICKALKIHDQALISHGPAYHPSILPQGAMGLTLLASPLLIMRMSPASMVLLQVFIAQASCQIKSQFCAARLC